MLVSDPFNLTNKAERKLLDEAHEIWQLRLLDETHQGCGCGSINYDVA